MVDKNLLRSEFAKKGLTQGEVAKLIGISKNTMSKKLNTGIFGTDEAMIMIEALSIENPAQIFFAQK